MQPADTHKSPEPELTLAAEARQRSRATPDKLSRWGLVLATIVVGASVSGFLFGLNEPARPTGTNHHRAKPLNSVVNSNASTDVLTAPRYEMMDSSKYGPNQEWESKLNWLKPDRPSLFDSVVRTPAMKLAALEDRLRTRAFDGAPPAIPHIVDQRSAESCLACHGQGLVVAGKVATRMSHALVSNCTQCHVEQNTNVPIENVATTRAVSSTESSSMASNSNYNASTARNTFEGVKRAGPGRRSMFGSPPTIPHTLQMREDCMSCHGLVARPGLRTTHPWLQNCRQCHAADGEFERGLFFQTEVMVAK